MPCDYCQGQYQHQQQVKTMINLRWHLSMEYSVSCIELELLLIIFCFLISDLYYVMTISIWFSFIIIHILLSILCHKLYYRLFTNRSTNWNWYLYFSISEFQIVHICFWLSCHIYSHGGATIMWAHVGCRKVWKIITYSHRSSLET